jgi:hypothetical protein
MERYGPDPTLGLPKSKAVKKGSAAHCLNDKLKGIGQSKRATLFDSKVPDEAGWLQGELYIDLNLLFFNSFARRPSISKA